MTLATQDSELVREAIQEARLGQKESARRIFEEACRLNFNNEKAWLWRASLADTTDDAAYFLEQVLRINPDNQTALTWYAKCTPKPQSSASENEAPTFECPFCSHSSESDFTHCHRCRAILNLDLDAIVANTAVDERQLRYAVDHYRNIASRHLNAENLFDLHYYLAIAELNLCNSNAALRHLVQATELSPGDPDLLTKIKTLRGRKQVMIVDDSLTIRGMVARVLERNRYRACPAASAVDALGILRDQSMDLILLDVSMPYMDGYQLCRALKDDAKTRKTPILMLSGHDGFLDKVKARWSGARGFVSKPFEPATLLRVIAKHIE